jgi:fumarate hydratase class II
MSDKFRIEYDSLGEVRVPQDALYGPQTQRAVDNFQISGSAMPAVFIRVLGMIKLAAAHVNQELGLISAKKSVAIQAAAHEVTEGLYNKHFPVDVFQTGSGTSTNMNVNEVIARLASKRLGQDIHPNDDVNMGRRIGSLLYRGQT